MKFLSLFIKKLWFKFLGKNMYDIEVLDENGATISDVGSITCHSEIFELRKNQTIKIPIGLMHRTFVFSDIPNTNSYDNAIWEYGYYVSPANNLKIEMDGNYIFITAVYVSAKVYSGVF